MEELKAAILEALKKPDRYPIAAFDADGTLWPHDMGEALFNYQLENKLLDGLPEDPWGHYFSLKREGRNSEAYLWLAQVNAGVPETRLRQWAQESVERYGQELIRPPQKELIEFLHQNDFEVYVVTASIKWAVEPGAALYGIPRDHVIGIETEVVDGVLTDRQKGPITWKEGKVKGLLQNTGDRHPILAAGNTMGDIPLMESASDVRLAIASARPEERLYRTEQQVQELAKERGWFFHHFDD